MYTFYASEEKASSKWDLPGNSQSIAVGDRAGYTIRTDGSLYVWGFNHENFLKNGEENFIEIREEHKLTKNSIVEVSCRGKERVFTSS